VNVDGHCTFSGSVVVVAVSSDRVEVPLRRGIVECSGRKSLDVNKQAKQSAANRMKRERALASMFIVCGDSLQKMFVESKVARSGDDITRSDSASPLGQDPLSGQQQPHRYQLRSLSVEDRNTVIHQGTHV
jgi:hypothetical protein